MLDRVPPARGDAEVGGGWFGWLGYGLGARVERLPPRLRGRWRCRTRISPTTTTCCGSTRRGGGGSRRCRKEGLDRLDRVRELLAEAPEPPIPAWGRSRCAPRARRAHVGGARVRRADRRGGDLPGEPLPAAGGGLGRRHRATLFAARAGGAAADLRRLFVTRRGARIASLSPELFLRRRGRAVGRADQGDRAAGAATRAVLRASAKDHAENVMIVDLDAQRPRARVRVRHGRASTRRRSRAARRRLASRVRGPRARCARTRATARCCARRSRRGR